MSVHLTNRELVCLAKYGAAILNSSCDVSATQYQQIQGRYRQPQEQLLVLNITVFGLICAASGTAILFYGILLKEQILLR